MTDDQAGEKSALATFIEDVADALVARASRTDIDPKQAAAEAVSELIRHGNLNANELTTSQVAAKLRRLGWNT